MPSADVEVSYFVEYKTPGTNAWFRIFTYGEDSTPLSFESKIQATEFILDNDERYPLMRIIEQLIIEREM